MPPHRNLHLMTYTTSPSRDYMASYYGAISWK